MANQLSVAEVHSIVTLYERGWSCRRIARELGVDRETVGKYIRQARAPAAAKPAKAPPGSGEAKPAKAPTGSVPSWGAGAQDQDASIAGGAPPGRAEAEPEPSAPQAPPATLSDCRPYHALIMAKLDQGLSAQRIYQDLVVEHGDDHAPASGGAPSYYSVRRYVQRLVSASPLPFRRME